jgi:DNA-binding LacI/PurR family transcriptional regulator
MAARFLAVKQSLWTDIQGGRFGRKLPPEPELAKVYGVSRMTLRRSLAQLVGEGFLEAKPGQGTFVTDQRRSMGDTRTIGLLIGPYIGEVAEDAYFGVIFTTLAARFGAAGYMLTFATSAEHLAPAAPTIGERVMRRPVDGVVAAAFDADTVWSVGGLRVPLVLANSNPLPGRSTVLPENRAPVLAIVQHLVGLGHRRMAHLTGSLSTVVAQERLLAWREGLALQHLAVDESLILPGNFTIEFGYDAMAKLCALPGGPPTAVVCANDRMALGVLRYAAEHGVRVPEEVTVIGFDDIDTAQHTTPTLTTVHVPRVDFADAVFRTLVEDMESTAGEPAGRTIRVPTTMVLRGSSGPARAP